VPGNRATTNSSLRERFGLGSERATQISRLIADADQTPVLIVEDA
jgi:hypothetical protein